MKKELTIAAITLLLTATPAFAQSSHANNDHSRGKSTDAHTNHDNGSVKGVQTQNIPLIRTSEPDGDETTVTPTSIPTVTPSTAPQVTPAAASSSTLPCNPDDNWKNHGAYVSCVARLHEDGNEVVEAAHSDIGKKHQEENLEPGNAPSPSISPTPSATPSVTPSITPTTVTPTPISSPMNEINEGESPLFQFQSLFGRFFGFFRHWHLRWF